MKFKAIIANTDIIIGYTKAFDPKGVNDQGYFKERLLSMALHNGIITDDTKIEWEWANDEDSITLEEIKKNTK